MESDVGLSKVVMAEKVVEEADSAVCTLADVYTLIDEVIDLCLFK